MSYTRDDVIDLIKKDWKLKDISDFTGLPIDSIKKTSQMVKLYKRVADENLENYLKILKHDALLFSRFKVDSELSKAIKYVMEQTNGEKISRAKLRELLDNYSNTNNSIDVGPEMMKFNKLLEQIEYLVNKYSKDDLDFIGLVHDLDFEHPSFFVLKYKITSDAKKKLELLGYLQYSEFTYYSYILNPVGILVNLDKINFGDRYKKPLDLDINYVKYYIEKYHSSC